MQHKQRFCRPDLVLWGHQTCDAHWRWTELEKTIESSLTDPPADNKYAESAGPLTEHTHRYIPACVHTCTHTHADLQKQPLKEMFTQK